MPDVRQILTDWSTSAGGGFVTVMYFHADSDVADQRAAIATMWNSTHAFLTTTTNWRVRETGVDLDEATGALTGAWADSPTYADNGEITGQSVADATQMLLQWHTSTVVGKRFLQGRTFVPGLAASELVGGNLSPTIITAMSAIEVTFLDALVGFSVWHRPTSGAGGAAISVTSGTVWSELAVLRRRRK